MKYMGSKSKISQPIVEIIQSRLLEYGFSHFIDAFVGGANIVDKIECNYKYASDKQKYLIALYQNLERVKELPDFVTKEHYSEVRNCFNKKNNLFEDWYVGAIGFLASYNGRFFDGGYAGIVETKSGTKRNYYDEAKRNLIQQIPSLKKIIFCNKEYEKIKSDISGYIIYCDPPYQNTKQYGSSKNFDHEHFFDWCRKMSEKNIILISEEHAPSDFKCIWKQELTRTINHQSSKEAIEKLFEYKIETRYGMKEDNFKRKITEEDICEMEEFLGRKINSNIHLFAKGNYVEILEPMTEKDDICYQYAGLKGIITKETFYLGKQAYYILFEKPLSICNKLIYGDYLYPNEIELIS